MASFKSFVSRLVLIVLLSYMFCKEVQNPFLLKITRKVPNKIKDHSQKIRSILRKTRKLKFKTPGKLLF
jgi:hypothetical protein